MKELKKCLECVNCLDTEGESVYCLEFEQLVYVKQANYCSYFQPMSGMINEVEL